MLVSVVLPAYNAEIYLKAAIDSILCQTFTDFELIVINDGSSDSTKDIILEYSDPRIVYVENEKNLGLIETLNKGLLLSRGKYIARMDADDICVPDRFEIQVDFLEKNIDYIICSSAALSFADDNLTQTKYLYMPVSDGAINVRSFFNNAFVHPAVMMRRSVLIDNQLYFKAEYKYAEDYGLWVDLLKFGKGYNFAKPLIYYRVLNNSQSAIGNKHLEERFKVLNSIHKVNLKNKGIHLSEAHLNKLFYLSKVDRMKMIKPNEVTDIFDIFDILFLEIRNKYNDLDAQMALGRFYVMFLYTVVYKMKFTKHFFKINSKLLTLGLFDYVRSKTKVW